MEHRRNMAAYELRRINAIASGILKEPKIVQSTKKKTASEKKKTASKKQTKSEHIIKEPFKKKTTSLEGTNLHGYVVQMSPSFGGSTELP